MDFTRNYVYCRPDLSPEAVGTEQSWFYGTFGKPNRSKILYMSETTFYYLLERMNIDTKDRIISVEEELSVFGMRIIVNNLFPDYYIHIEEEVYETIDWEKVVHISEPTSNVFAD